MSGLSAATRATGAGALAILLWGALALLTTATAGIPPFQVLTLTFAVGGGAALLRWLALGENPLRRLVLPLPVWALGIYGLFGYHALYFIALKNAPAVEANLLNYSWPLLIVVFSGFLPGGRIGRPALAGAGLGLAGCVLLIAPQAVAGGGDGHALGYAAAAGCGLVWSSYSVLSRRYAEIPSDAVGAYCLGTSALAALVHLGTERWVAPALEAWAVIFAMGLGPVGFAFFVWDHGMKHGDIRLLGVLSYATPLLSTLLLILFGDGRLSWIIAAAAALIVGGAVLAGLGGGRAKA